MARWAGLRTQNLRALGQARVRGIGTGAQMVPLYAAALWIHRNRPGQRDQLTDESPHRLALDTGIALHPHQGADAPRLPLLGLRALVTNNLHLAIDGRRRYVTLRAPRRWWFFG